jgi:tripartite-type tricarboxylate transporter receptor subunit TctC
MQDCQPTLVVAAGVDGLRALEEILGRTIQVGRTISRGGAGGTCQWTAYATTCDGRPVTVAQVPHFSRASVRPQLDESRRRLGEIVPGKPTA